MMKKKRFTAFLLAVSVLFSTFFTARAEGFPYTWKEEDGGPHCKSLFLVNLDTDAVAYAMNPDEPLPMASLTKIMSYIVAYETIPDIENTVITVPDSVVDELEGTYSSEAGIQPGEELTGLQLLYLMMVPSGNDAALTLAKYVDELYRQGKITDSQEGNAVPGGKDREDLQAPAASAAHSGSSGGESSPSSSGAGASSEGGSSNPPEGGNDPVQDPTNYSDSFFVRLMNRKAQELGCENTHFTNAHGLHNENHYSTARDLYKITRYAMSLPNFTEITSTQAYDLAPTNIRSDPPTAYSTNKMFSQYEDEGRYFYTYTTGIKTGSLNESGYCIVASATADGYTYVAVALGSPYVDEEGEPTGFHGEMVDARELFRWALVDLKKKTVAAQGDLMTEVDLMYAWKKDTLQLVAGETASALLPQSVNLSSITIDCEIPESVQAPVKKGEQIGYANLSYAGEKIATIPLVAAESVAKSQMLEGLVQGGTLFTSSWFLVILGIVLALVAVYILLVLIYRKKQKRLRRVKHYRDM